MKKTGDKQTAKKQLRNTNKTEKKTASHKRPKSESSLREGKVENPDAHLKDLRKRAEEKLRTRLFDISTVPGSALKEVFHELQVHQIELEVQNEEMRMSQASLEESRARYADLYDFAPVGYFTLNNKGVVLEANLTGAGMLGIKRRELIEKPFTLFIHKDDLDAFYFHKEKAFETGGTESCELRLKRKEGVLWARLQSVTDKDFEHQVLRLRTVVSDITSQKNAEASLRESEERYRSIFEGANDGIISCDLGSGKFPFVNKRMCELTGYSEEEILSLKVKDLHPEKDLPHVLDTFNRMASGEVTDARSVPVLRKDGSVIYCDISASFLRRNPASILLGFFRDITDRELAVRDLERSNRELEEFAYIVSHDLKEPLRMITSYVQILNKRYKGKLDEKADEFIDFIVEGTTRMDDLLDDLLAYSRVGKKGGPFQPVDLNDIVRFALDNLKRVVNKSEAEIHYADLPTVVADEVQMIQVFQNLIGNAIKFRGSESPGILISAEPAGHEWKICVQDNGIGIDPKHLERIFLMFRRLHARGKYPGTGVGLSICKKIVERHGGRIWAESGAGKGSRFCFTINK